MGRLQRLLERRELPAEQRQQPEGQRRQLSLGARQNPLHLASPFCSGDPELGGMAADGVDQRGTLLDEPIPHGEQHGPGLLLLALDLSDEELTWFIRQRATEIESGKVQ